MKAVITIDFPDMLDHCIDTDDVIDEVLPEVTNMIKQGYREGEANWYDEENCVENRGWWTIKVNSEE